MRSLLRSYVADESGAVASEYGLIAAVVAVACIPALETLGCSARDLLDASAQKVEAARP